MSVQLVDQWENGNYTTHKRLIKYYIDKEDPSDAVDGILHLSELLILSNQLIEAHLIASAVYRLVNDGRFADTGDSLDSRTYLPITLDIFWTSWISGQQWDKYRECTRTGWMLEHVGLAEPESPSSTWRETDDPAMLAMCVRLLAKTTTPGTYPPAHLAREALEAAQKLYAKPDTPKEECGWGPEKPKRQSYLLYRRLIVDLAIRLGELQSAADILGQGLRQDSFTNGGELRDFLLVPGIYNVLLLLALSEKESNHFFISKEDAVVMWALHPSKVGWKELLDRLAEGAWRAHPKKCQGMGMKHAMDLLYEPATEEEIAAAEDKVGELPADFKEMLRVANGFKGGWHFFAGGIAGIQSITTDEGGNAESGYLHYDEDLAGIKCEIIQLQAGTICDSYRHFIIPPRYWKEGRMKAGKEVKDGEYQYWHWAFWEGSGIFHWESARDLVCSCGEEVEEMIEMGIEEDWESCSDLDSGAS
ncbi:hypothetical protein PENCOP_c006G00016 [Penicillium coprophilum]|uniref:Knr4/Smi1-like domain-containing protein n=1 Tax=Penicillium coprophilum TaxID=36646 RepID=A0A1V6UPA9_9EURO|nr:hypothetical protein PENCOP_c006G00016 [Penicillium coprophilum]